MKRSIILVATGCQRSARLGHRRRGAVSAAGSAFESGAAASSTLIWLRAPFWSERRAAAGAASSIVAFDATASEAPMVEALSEDYPDLWPSKPPPAPSKVRGRPSGALGACDRVDDDTVAAVLGDLPALSDNEAKRLLAAALAALANVKAQEDGHEERARRATGRCA